MVGRFLSIICNVAAALFGWASLAVSIAAVALITWSDDGVRRYGLFYYCFLGGNEDCFWLETFWNGGHWLRAVRGNVICMIILGGFGCLANLAAFAKKNDKNIKTSAAGLFYLGALTGIIGLAIYTGKKEAAAPSYEYGSAFILGWIGCWSFMVAGLFQSFAGCFAPGYEVH